MAKGRGRREGRETGGSCTIQAGGGGHSDAGEGNTGLRAVRGELCGARRGAPPAEEAQSRALAQEVGRPRTTALLPLRRCYVVRETDQ